MYTEIVVEEIKSKVAKVTYQTGSFWLETDDDEVYILVTDANSGKCGFVCLDDGELFDTLKSVKDTDAITEAEILKMGSCGDFQLITNSMINIKTTDTGTGC